MLKSKLIHLLKQSNAWTELTDALQRVNDQAVEPTLARLKGMTNVFTMHPDDLQVLFDEMGAFFSVGKTEQEDVPSLLQQLYAPKDLKKYPYGAKFLLLRDIKKDQLDRNDYFQTKRAVIFTRQDHVTGKFANINEFEQLLYRVAVPLLPTHTAFNGQY